LAPLIPFIRKEAEDSDGTRLVQRNGFDNGYIRRCEIQLLQIPTTWKTLTYEPIEPIEGGEQITISTGDEIPKFGRLVQFSK